MMNKFIKTTTIAFFLLLTANSFAQQQERPLKWTGKVEQTTADSATIIFTAIIEKGWHTYSQFTPDGGPIGTVFTFPKSRAYDTVGKTSEPKPDEAFDKDFGVKVLSLKDSPVFRQKIAVKDKKKFTIPVKIDYEACKDKCLFLDTTIVLTVNPKSK